MRESGLENLTFTTYDQLLQLLASRVVPDDDSLFQSFITFNRIRFDCDSEASGISFSTDFAERCSKLERKKMSDNSIEPLTLWHAMVTIKSHARCASTKSPLTREEYVALPPSFGLQQNQRELCYELFLKYETWRQQGGFWDEFDRVTYVLRHGPSVYRDATYMSWKDRLKRGEVELLDEEGSPMHPFFFDMVASDEGQDFVSSRHLSLNVDN